LFPGFGTPFSTFQFQPGRSRLFISTGHRRLIAYNVKQQQVLPHMATKFVKDAGVAANTISFDPKNHHKILVASSKGAMIKHLSQPNTSSYKFPYKDILFVAYAGPNQIVIFEKPWALMMDSLPKVFEAKRFLTTNEERLSRY
jgi:hypothetical protein